MIGKLTRSVVAALLLASLGACTGSGNDELYFATTRGAEGPPIFPANYRAELLAFMRTYLNDPTNVRDASVSEPVQKQVAGRPRYVVCVRYDARDSAGRYTGVADRVAFFLDGRFDRMIERSQDFCPAPSYAAFPELERLTR